MRLQVIYQMIDSDGLAGTLTPVYPREATQDEITAIHTLEYYQAIASTAERGGMVFLDADTSACPETFRAAKLAAGGLLALVDVVQERFLDTGLRSSGRPDITPRLIAPWGSASLTMSRSRHAT